MIKSIKNWINDKRSYGKAEIHELICPLFWITLIFISVSLVIIPIIGEQPQKYTDFIIELTAITNRNKSGEMTFFWTMLGLVLIFYCLIARKYYKKRYFNKLFELADRIFESSALIGISIVTNIISILISGKVSVILMLAPVFFYIIKLIDKRVARSLFLTYILTYYCVSSIIAIYNSFVGDFRNSPLLRYITSDKEIIIISVITVTVLTLLGKMFSRDLNKWLINILCIEQLLIPGLLSVVYLNRYYYKGEMQVIGFSVEYIGIMVVLQLGLIGMAVFHLLKVKRNGIEDSFNIVFMSSVISIALFNTFSSMSLVVPSDWHHSGENINAWYQVFEKGQKLYIDYSPPSGLFAFIAGFVKNIIFDGKAVYTNASIEIIRFVFAAIVVILVMKRTNSLVGLFISIFFPLDSYNRTHLLVVAMLLVTMPELLERINRWLKIWIWSVFLCGLYYPIYGVALAVGTFPLAGWQIIRYKKSGELVQNLKKRSFIIEWIICLFPIFCSIPMLLRMMKHILLHASQTQLADGIALWNSLVPSSFMPYVQSSNIKNVVYYAVVMLIPTIAVVICIMLFRFCLFRSCNNISKSLQDYVTYLLFIPGAVLAIGYTYTMVRLEEGVIISRSASLINAVLVIYGFTIVYKYGNSFLSKASKNFVLGLIVAIGLILKMDVYNEGLFENRGLYTDAYSKISSSYIVSDEYEFTVSELDKACPRVGDGYILTAQSDELLSQKDIVDRLGREDRYIVNLGSQYEYELLEQKVPLTPLITTDKSYDTESKIIDFFEENDIVVRGISSWDNYYLYYWMMKNNFTYNHEYGYAVKQDEYESIFGQKPSETLDYSYVNYHTVATFASYIEIAGALGRSMETLAPRMDRYSEIEVDNLEFTEDNEYTCRLNLGENVNGFDADFLYLELDTQADLEKDYTSFNSYFQDNEKGKAITVKITWENKYDEAPCEMEYYIDHGKLLIPLGTNPYWLTQEHRSINVSVIYNTSEKTQVRISSAKLLQLEK